MPRGTVKNIIQSGAAFIQSSELADDAFCSPNLVKENDLSPGAPVDFEIKKTNKGFNVTTIKRIEPGLFKYALILNQLSSAEYDDFCNETKAYVHTEQFKKNVTTSKIRNIFTAVSKSKNEKSLKMLRPKLAYLAGRDSGTAFFMNDLDELIKKITTDDEVKNFKKFFEAIICYAKEND